MSDSEYSLIDTSEIVRYALLFAMAATLPCFYFAIGIVGFVPLIYLIVETLYSLKDSLVLFILLAVNSALYIWLFNRLSKWIIGEMKTLSLFRKILSFCMLISMMILISLIPFYGERDAGGGGTRCLNLLGILKYMCSWM